MHKHLRRLKHIWIDFPIYFITACVRNRKAVLSRGEAAQILVQEWRAAHTRHGWVIGRYVIMPDQVHFFCRAEIGAKTLSEFVGNWKSRPAFDITECVTTGTARLGTESCIGNIFAHIYRISAINRLRLGTSSLQKME